MELLRKLWEGESGQDLIEYALLAALLASVSFLALQGMGLAVAAYYGRLNVKLTAIM